MMGNFTLKKGSNAGLASPLFPHPSISLHHLKVQIEASWLDGILKFIEAFTRHLAMAA